LFPLPTASLTNTFEAVTKLKNIIITTSFALTMAPRSSKKVLGVPFNGKPKPNDALFGSGGLCNNIRKGSLYRELITKHWQAYKAIPNQKSTEKKRMIREKVIEPIRENRGRFLQYEDKQFSLLSLDKDSERKAIYEKIAQAFRSEKKNSERKEVVKNIAQAKKKTNIAELKKKTNTAQAKKKTKCSNAVSKSESLDRTAEAPSPRVSISSFSPVLSSSSTTTSDDEGSVPSHHGAHKKKKSSRYSSDVPEVSDDSDNETEDQTVASRTGEAAVINNVDLSFFCSVIGDLLTIEKDGDFDLLGLSEDEADPLDDDDDGVFSLDNDDDEVITLYDDDDDEVFPLEDGVPLLGKDVHACVMGDIDSFFLGTPCLTC
jgi:hypothetical protein